jgi:NAD(P)-dependent dehydrogenase (short-subunit alcohol dehydrogenase family)
MPASTRLSVEARGRWHAADGTFGFASAESGNVQAMAKETSLAEWHKVIDSNLTASFLLSQIAYPQMKKRGGGKIINIGSMASYMGGARWLR